jgi:hypothetical protein
MPMTMAFPVFGKMAFINSAALEFPFSTAVMARAIALGSPANNLFVRSSVIGPAELGSGFTKTGRFPDRRKSSSRDVPLSLDAAEQSSSCRFEDSYKQNDRRLREETSNCCFPNAE